MNQGRREIYLDSNATTRVRPEVIEVIARHCRDTFANPGSRHAPGRRARRVLEDSRESVARILGAEPDEVIFTSGGTESINLAINGLCARRGGLILLTAGEHPATLETCRALAAQSLALRELAVARDGTLVAEQYADLPWGEVRLATVILAHNETGVIQDLAPLAEFCRTRGVPLHADALQAVGKIPVHFRELGVTALSLGAHKFRGPRGVGALLVKRGVQLRPQQFGGHQETERRPGTEAVPLIAGMARALELWHAEQADTLTRVTQLRDRLERGLSAGASPAVVNAASAPRLPNTLNIAFPGVDGEALLVALDLEGIACSLGSTCSSGSSQPAPALVAMGCPPEVIRSSIRFSVGIENTEGEIDEAISRITSVVQRLRA